MHYMITFTRHKQTDQQNNILRLLDTNKQTSKIIFTRHKQTDQQNNILRLLDTNKQTSKIIFYVY